MSGGLMSCGLKSGGLMSGGLMSGGLKSWNRIHPIVDDLNFFPDLKLLNPNVLTHN